MGAWGKPGGETTISGPTPRIGPNGAPREPVAVGGAADGAMGESVWLLWSAPRIADGSEAGAVPALAATPRSNRRERSAEAATAVWIAVCGTRAGRLGGKQRRWPGPRGFAKGDQQLAL